MTPKDPLCINARDLKTHCHNFNQPICIKLIFSSSAYTLHYIPATKNSLIVLASMLSLKGRQIGLTYLALLITNGIFSVITATLNRNNESLIGIPSLYSLSKLQIR